MYQHRIRLLRFIDDRLNLFNRSDLGTPLDAHALRVELCQRRLENVLGGGTGAVGNDQYAMFHDLPECLDQIANDVGSILDTERQPDQRVRNSDFGALGRRKRSMRGLRRMRNRCRQAAKARRKADHRELFL